MLMPTRAQIGAEKLPDTAALTSRVRIGGYPRLSVAPLPALSHFTDSIMNQRPRLLTPHDSEKKPGMADVSYADALILALDDSVAADRKDIVREQTLQHLAEGFTGMITIRPAQTCIINEAFAPSASMMEHAMRMVAVSGRQVSARRLRTS
jgi:citrate lyase beta subunit